MDTCRLSILAMVFAPLGLLAQITFEEEYQADTAGGQPLLITLAVNEHKYLIPNYTAGTFDLMNLDHTPYLLSISAPVPLYQLPNWYQPCLVTRSLFDCDTTNIEFAVASTHVDDADQFLIVRTTGAVLFSEVNATFPYCYGCAVGTRVDKGVYRTEVGTKMMLMLWDGVPGEVRFRVYDLCGELSEGMAELPVVEEVLVFPNPSDGMVTLQLPMKVAGGTHFVEVLNGLGQMVGSFSFQGHTATIDPRSLKLTPGSYDLLIVGQSQSFHSRLLIHEH